jgi:hypothetical protein
MCAAARRGTHAKKIAAPPGSHHGGGMKRFPIVLVLALALTLAFVGGAGWWWARQRRAPPPAPSAAPTPGQPRAEASPGVPLPAPRAPITGPSAEEKTARIEKIRRDYEEIAGKISTDYAAAGSTFPGGLNAFLRQLALLAREKRADLAAFLSPGELEDIELRDTPSGQTVQRLLGGTAATEEQRRAVFRLQLAFEDKFALTFDLSPPALLARESQRMVTQMKIREVLGDALFGAWLNGEGTDYPSTVAFVKQQGLAASVPLELWQVKNDFILERLQLRARTDLSPTQMRSAEAALANQVRARVAGLIGPAALATAGSEVLGWLPAPPNPPGK